MRQAPRWLRAQVHRLRQVLLCLRSQLLLLVQARGRGGKTKFARRGRIDTIRGGSFFRLKLSGCRRLIRHAGQDLLCSHHRFPDRLANPFGNWFAADSATSAAGALGSCTATASVTASSYGPASCSHGMAHRPRPEASQARTPLPLPQARSLARRRRRPHHGERKLGPRRSEPR